MDFYLVKLSQNVHSYSTAELNHPQKYFRDVQNDRLLLIRDLWIVCLHQQYSLTLSFSAVTSVFHLLDYGVSSTKHTPYVTCMHVVRSTYIYIIHAWAIFTYLDNFHLFELSEDVYARSVPLVSISLRCAP